MGSTKPSGAPLAIQVGILTVLEVILAILVWALALQVDILTVREVILAIFVWDLALQMVNLTAFVFILEALDATVTALMAICAATVLHFIAPSTLLHLLPMTRCTVFFTLDLLTDPDP